jgi:parallel beta-helix repeat protein
MTLSSYTQHEPIEIQNDTALATYAVSGTGDPGTPYILEGWNITTDDLRAIFIGFTTKYFIVRDCWLLGARDAAQRGILIDAVANGTALIEHVHCESWYVGIEVSSSPETVVKGCSIQDCQEGLFMSSSTNSTVFNNTVFENDDWGVSVYSQSVTVANNTLWGNTHGIGVFHVDDVRVENNTLIDDGFSFLLDTIASYETISEKNNIVNGMALLLLVNKDGTTYDGGFGQAILINCTGAKLANQNLSYCETGAYLRWCTDCQIRDSHLDHNDGSGLHVYYSDNIDIENVSTSLNSLYGFELTHCTVNITDCDIVQNKRGVESTGSWGALSIQNSSFVNNTDFGLSLTAGWNESVTDNTFTDDGIYCLSWTMEDYVGYTDNITGNLANGRPLVFYSSLENVTISSPHGQIFLFNCSNVMLSSLDCSHTVIGISIAFSNGCSIIDSDCGFAKQMAVSILFSNFTLVQNVNCGNSYYNGIQVVRTEETTLLDNYCSNDMTGIAFYDSKSGLLEENTLTGNRNRGLQISNSADTLVYSNICNHNQFYGIYAQQSTGLTFANNTCNFNNEDGMYIEECSEIVLEGNDYEMNAYSGLFLDSSWSCILTSNRIADNQLDGLYVLGGISFDINWNTILANGGCGIFIGAMESVLMHNIIALNDGYGAYLISCINMSVHHNTFVNNNGGGIQARCTGHFTVLWYDQSTAQGNYWSDWGGVGPYFIDGDAEARDIYPLGEVDSDSDTLPDSWEIANGLNPFSADSDADSLPDAWEVMYGLNPLANDTAGDLDDDGLSNLEEYILGLNPASNDSDGDSMPDLWEVQNYLNPLYNDAGFDPDGDDISNLYEYLGGTNPHVYNGSSTTTTTTTTQVSGDMLPVILAGVGGFSIAIVIIILIQMYVKRRRAS